jgi:hypothetical protein
VVEVAGNDPAPQDEADQVAQYRGQHAQHRLRRVGNQPAGQLEQGFHADAAAGAGRFSPSFLSGGSFRI